MSQQHTVAVAGNVIVLDDQQDTKVDVWITTTKLEVQACGETVARLIVEREDGEQAIFFLSVRLSNRGRPSVALITKKPDRSEVRKSVQGYWKTPRIGKQQS